MSREILLRKLILTGHLSVAERDRLEPNEILETELLRLIEREVVDAGYFPPQARPQHLREPVFEGWSLESTWSGARACYRRHRPLDPGRLAEQHTRDFRSLAEAIRFYIDSEYRGDIDGIPIRR